MTFSDTVQIGPTTEKSGLLLNKPQFLKMQIRWIKSIIYECLRVGKCIHYMAIADLVVKLSNKNSKK